MGYGHTKQTICNSHMLYLVVPYNYAHISEIISSTATLGEWGYFSFMTSLPNGYNYFGRRFTVYILHCYIGLNEV